MSKWAFAVSLLVVLVPASALAESLEEPPAGTPSGVAESDEGF